MEIIVAGTITPLGVYKIKKGEGWGGVGGVAWDLALSTGSLFAALAIAKLRNRFHIVVHSARCRTESGRTAIAKWLELHGIEVDEICEHKPPAHVYVDDRAVHFNGDWDAAISAIHDFRR